MPAFAIMFPDNTKNGMARSKNLLIPEYILVATMVRDVPEYRIAQDRRQTKADANRDTKDQKNKE